MIERKEGIIHVRERLGVPSTLRSELQREVSQMQRSCNHAEEGNHCTAEAGAGRHGPSGLAIFYDVTW